MCTCVQNEAYDFMHRIFSKIKDISWKRICIIQITVCNMAMDLIAYKKTNDAASSHEQHANFH